MNNPKHYLKEILKETLPKYCRGNVIDVGAGHAKYSSLIAPLCDSYTTLDNMSSSDQFNKSPFVPDIVADVLDMPVKSNSFETVICTEVLEHVPDPFRLMAEISRILKPGGHALVSSGWLAPYHREPKDYWRFSLDGYRELLKRSGLEFVDSRKKGGLWCSLFYCLYRHLELNAKDSLLQRIVEKIRKPVELLLFRIDRRLTSEDTIGHVVIAKKPL